MKNIFVKTKNVKAFIALATKLKHTQKNIPKMGLIYGDPGLGKTNAILWWLLNQNAIIVTAKNGMTTRWFLSDLVADLGETPQYNISALFEQATRKLIEKPQMLIIDEVDYLINESRAIETIRDLHDKTGIPVLLVGMGAVDKKLRRYKHLFDRIIEIYKFEPFNLDDAKEIIRTISEVYIEDEVIEEIHKRANRFRQIVNILTKIEHLAKSEGYTKITKEELGW